MIIKLAVNFFIHFLNPIAAILQTIADALSSSTRL